MIVSPRSTASNRSEKCRDTSVAVMVFTFPRYLIIRFRPARSRLTRALSRRATRRLQGKRSSVGDLYQPEPFRYHQGVIIYREFRVAHLGAHFGTVPEPFMSGSPLLH